MSNHINQIRNDNIIIERRKYNEDNNGMRRQPRISAMHLDIMTTGRKQVWECSTAAKRPWQIT